MQGKDSGEFGGFSPQAFVAHHGAGYKKRTQILIGGNFH